MFINCLLTSISSNSQTKHQHNKPNSQTQVRQTSIPIDWSVETRPLNRSVFSKMLFAWKHGHEYASQVFFIRRSVQNVWRQCVGENQLSHIHDASQCEWKTVKMAATNVSSMQSNVSKCEVIILATKKNCAIFPASACNETVWIVSEVLLRLSASRSSYNAFLQFHKNICKLYIKVLYLSSFKRDIINT